MFFVSVHGDLGRAGRAARGPALRRRSARAARRGQRLVDRRSVPGGDLRGAGGERHPRRSRGAAAHPRSGPDRSGRPAGAVGRSPRGAHRCPLRRRSDRRSPGDRAARRAVHRARAAPRADARRPVGAGHLAGGAARRRRHPGRRRPRAGAADLRALGPHAQPGRGALGRAGGAGGGPHPGGRSAAPRRRGGRHGPQLRRPSPLVAERRRDRAAGAGRDRAGDRRHARTMSGRWWPPCTARGCPPRC